MKKWKKPRVPVAQLSMKELQLVMKISTEMDEFVRNFDYYLYVQNLLKKLKKKHFGVQIFIVNNLLNFSPSYWYKPEEIIDRYETHMKIKSSKKSYLKDDIVDWDFNSTDSKDVNRALK